MSEEKYCKDSCDMKRVEHLDDLATGEPGAFCIAEEANGHAMYMKLPNGFAGVLTLSKSGSHHDPGAGKYCWHWDGNLEKPTLTPSVHQLGCWHGWIRNGRMESC